MAGALETVVTGIASRVPARDLRLSGSLHPPQAQRSEASRDADRILYSSAWRRLAGVTQVLTPFEGQATLHTRLTHSEKVAQVAKAIARNLLGDKKNHHVLTKLGGYSSDVCETAGLAHDIGHPPFGHIGESVLDDIARETLGLRDGFEGNAQSLRIITMRRIRSPLYEGLDLTYASTAAVLKYPWIRGTRNDVSHDDLVKSDPSYRRHWNKFNAYDEQQGLLEEVRGFLPETYGPETQTLEASTMDVADDITYAMHDLEDFYISGGLNVTQVIRDLNDYSENQNRPDPDNTFTRLYERLSKDYPPTWLMLNEYRKAIGATLALMTVAFGGRSRPTSEDEESAVRARLSDEISELLQAVIVQEEVLWPGGPYLGLRRPEWHQVQILKDITKTYVIRDPDVALLQIGQQTLLTELVEMLKMWSKRDSDRLPRLLREEQRIARSLLNSPESIGYGVEKFANRGSPERAYLDFLCTLTDAQCISLHEKLSGRRPHRSVVGAGF